jgi:hypothetical protein
LTVNEWFVHYLSMPYRRALDPILKLPCFRNVAPQEAAILLANIDTSFAQVGQSFWAGADVGQELILVIQGELMSAGHQPRTFRPGMLAGALPMLDPTRRPYVVRATAPSRLGLLSHTQLHVLLAVSPALRRVMGAAVIEDLTSQQPSEMTSKSRHP